MTLIAAYRPVGIPVLLGDFLITGGGQESSRKKIYKVGSNFVIGWTGKLFLAAPILKALFEAFEGKTVTMREVDKFLTNRPKEELHGGELLLVGWVIDRTPHCFLWNIGYPTELFYEPFHVVGSGNEKFRELIARKTLGGSWGSRRTSIDQAIYSALAKATELYSDENLERMNRRQGFGYAYELLYFDGEEFRYLDNIAFFGLDILLNPENWTGRSQPYEHWYRYHSLGDVSFLQVMNFRNGEMRLETIHPVFTQTPRDASFEFTAGSFRADYYCIHLRLQTTQGESYEGSLVLAENKDGPSRYEKQEGTAYRFDLGQDLIRFLYEKMTAEREHVKTETIPWGWGSAETAEKMIASPSSFHCRIDQNDKCVVLGLIIDASWDKSYASMDHAIMACADSTIQIYEKGVAVGPLGKLYQPQDTFSISVEDVVSVPAVRYYVNAKLLYQTQARPQFPLRGAICLRGEGASISESKIIGSWAKKN